MITLTNNTIQIKVNPLGAELSSIFHLQNQLEYLWQAGKDWPKHSPVLFPIVGTLKDNKYFYKEKPYTMARHGFAREKIFTIIEQSQTSVTFSLKFDEQSLQVFPFEFELHIRYTIIENELTVTYTVLNVGNDTMYFSLGAHPAFRVPLEKEKNYEDYVLQFDKSISAHRWQIEGGLIAETSHDFLQNQSTLALQHSLFEKDAIVCKGFDSQTITLTDLHQTYGVEFHLNSCPFLGIWAAPNADFVCIEPWYGIADSVKTNQQIQDKEGILELEAHKNWEYEWAVKVF